MTYSSIHEFGWGGLNTRADSTGLPLLECVTLEDVRVIGRDLIQRLGIVRIGKVAGNFKATDLTSGDSEHYTCAADSRIWTLGKYWTWEALVEPDGVTGTQVIQGFNHASDYPIRVYYNAAVLTVNIVDTDDAVVTLTSGTLTATKTAIQVTRNGTAVELKIDNSSVDTDTVADKVGKAAGGDLYIGRDNGGNYYDGTIDYVRMFNTVKSSHADRLLRLPNPRARNVEMDLDFNATGTLIYDRSRYENHMVAVNSPTEIATLCHNPAPIRVLSLGIDPQEDKRQLLVLAGGNYFIADVA